MKSTRKQEANRRNAQKSTGPRSKAGRVRASRNALKHGLSAARRFYGSDTLVHDLARDLLAEFEMSCACEPDLLPIVEAEIDALRARHVRIILLNQLQSALKDDISADSVRTLLDQLSRVDRYERRALSRRKFAIRDLTHALNSSSLALAGNLSMGCVSQVPPEPPEND